MRKAAAPSSGLDRRIRLHDRHQFELKLEYQSPEGKAARYVVETFVCIPGSLNINPASVPTEQLYSDIHNYVRLKTPNLSWTEIEALPDSPLMRALEEAPRVAAGGDARRFVYEIRLLTCVVRARLRDLGEWLEARQDVAGNRRTAAVNAVDAALVGFRAVAARFRELAATSASETCPAEAREAYRLCDEYLSLSAEQKLRRVIVALSDARWDTSEARRRVLDLILEEEEYRRGRGYLAILNPASDNEEYVHRAGQLKKFCSAVLFLDVHRAEARTPVQELLFAVAAGIAMAFATVVAFWAQARYSVLGMRLFAILVIAYMFKDRLKEATRRVFASFLEKHFYDHNIRIEDPKGGVLGWCREKMEYLHPERLPDDVVAIRRAATPPGDAPVRSDEEARRESIFRYRKEVRLNSHLLEDRHGGAGVTDIVRFHVTRVLHEMDEPFQVIEWVDRDSLQLRPVQAAKVYHVDVIFRFISRPDQPPSVTLMRLVLDREGIKRIDRVAGDAG